jgi:uncharacterized tellurite resistance protein B-like protein
MRNYPRNSPEAAARVVALTMIADGVASVSELSALQASPLMHETGLAPEHLERVLRHLCEDLMASQTSGWGCALQVDDDMVDSALEEIDDHGLRQRVLASALSVAEADGHLSEGECHVLARAAWKWGVHPVVLMPGAPLARSLDHMALNRAT